MDCIAHNCFVKLFVLVRESNQNVKHTVLFYTLSTFYVTAYFPTDLDGVDLPFIYGISQFPTFCLVNVVLWDILRSTPKHNKSL